MNNLIDRFNKLCISFSQNESIHAIPEVASIISDIKNVTFDDLNDNEIVSVMPTMNSLKIYESMSEDVRDLVKLVTAMHVKPKCMPFTGDHTIPNYVF